MKSRACPLCKGKILFLDSFYDICESCGLNVKRNLNTVEITNESLNKAEILKLDNLTKFKIETVLKIDSKRKGILDIGTASGKFLYHARSYFNSVQGVEVNEKCIEFASKELELELVDSLSKVDLNKVSCITLWHSLEHLPLDVSKKIFLSIAEKAPNVPILISVPNADSFQFKKFGSKWPYYDKSSHLYQYSPKSLNFLMDSLGYELKRVELGALYEFFGYLQGLVNLFHPVVNYFYYRRKRGWDFGLSFAKLLKLDILNFVLIVLFTPLAALLLYMIREKTGVINYFYIRKSTIS